MAAPTFGLKQLQDMAMIPLVGKLKIDIRPQLRNAGQRLDNFKGTHFFEVIGPPDVVQLWSRLLDGDVFGLLSSMATVTLPSSARKAAMIPLDAAYFCFSHPLVGINGLNKEQRGEIPVSDPRHGYLCFGGYVYFDHSGNVLQINALTQSKSGDLHFVGPYELPAGIAKDLEDEGRFEDVTIAELREAGARRFAWMLPGEDQRYVEYPENAILRRYPVHHGAFAYKCTGGFSCYFPVAAKPAAKLALPTTTPGAAAAAAAVPP